MVDEFFGDPVSADTIELQLAQGRIKDHRGVTRSVPASCRAIDSSSEFCVRHGECLCHAPFSFATKLEYRPWWPGKKVLPPEWKPPLDSKGIEDVPPDPAHPGDFCGVCAVVPAEFKWQAVRLATRLANAYTIERPVCLPSRSPDICACKLLACVRLLGCRSAGFSLHPLSSAQSTLDHHR